MGGHVLRRHPAAQDSLVHLCNVGRMLQQHVVNQLPTQQLSRPRQGLWLVPFNIHLEQRHPAVAPRQLLLLAACVC